MIRFEQISKSFSGRTILRDLSFEVANAEILFVLGTSGTGKSVLLKSIVGLLRPETGKIWLDDQDLTALNEENYGEIRKKCGMVFQQPALFDSLSIYENVAYGMRRSLQINEQEIDLRVRESLKLVHLSAQIAAKMPGEISYGMQKRVSLARTIALRPQTLLFDEPTTGLDPINTQAINQLIQSLSRELKTTSIVVSHDMKCALQIADRILVLDQGGIAAIGTCDEMRKSTHPLVREFLHEAIASEGKDQP
jgi:phospholipid/cholesterol/gamma-HCH transport system ATP-binding protein